MPAAKRFVYGGIIVKDSGYVSIQQDEVRALTVLRHVLPFHPTR